MLDQNLSWDLFEATPNAALHLSVSLRTTRLTLLRPAVRSASALFRFPKPAKSSTAIRPSYAESLSIPNHFRSQNRRYSYTGLETGLIVWIDFRNRHGGKVRTFLRPGRCRLRHLLCSHLCRWHH